MILFVDLLVSIIDKLLSVLYDGLATLLKLLYNTILQPKLTVTSNLFLFLALNVNYHIM